MTDALQKDREGRGARRWRAAFRRIQQQLLDLEQDSRALELVYPQAWPLLSPSVIFRNMPPACRASVHRHSLMSSAIPRQYEGPGSASAQQCTAYCRLRLSHPCFHFPWPFALLLAM